jgi:hypothetical protein
MVKRAIVIAVLVIAAAPALRAGEPPELDIFGTAESCFDLTAEQLGVVDEINRQRDNELRDRMKEIARELDKKYIEIVGEALPAAEREKYQKLIAAQQERDEITARADAEYAGAVKTAFAQHKVEATPGRRLPHWWPASWSKDDLVDTYLKLNDEQRKTIDDLMRIREEGWRDESSRVQRPKDWRDPKAREKYGNELRDLRRVVEAETLEAMWPVLTEQQQKACTAAFEALAAWGQKVDQAVEACDKKIAEQVGEGMLRRLIDRRGR